MAKTKLVFADPRRLLSVWKLAIYKPKKASVK